MNPALKKHGGDEAVPPAKKHRPLLRTADGMFWVGNQPLFIAPNSADVSTPRTSLLSRIRAAKYADEKSCRHVGTTPIKYALRVGGIYDVIDIETVKTRNGSRQVWSLEEVRSSKRSAGVLEYVKRKISLSLTGVDDTSLRRVFSCADLDRHTVDDDGSLNQQDRRDMIKLFRVVYKGQSGENSKYSFEFREK